ARLRDSAINILEVGIGGYADPLSGGGSLRMWHDYFPKARIFGLDLHAKSFHIADRVRLYQGSQTDAALLRKIDRDAGGFDIIIDDGSHINEHVIATFNIMFPLLKMGGLYVVEDMQTSYWPVLGGSSDNPDSPRTMVGYFKSLIHGLNHAEINGHALRGGLFDQSIVAMSFYHNMVFVEKGDNSEPSNVPPGDPLRSNA
ncbi:MAG TPA: CmcI family methyltransferase, partial [Acetobacteraceae bacterium]|nr:CmcI family methyltransferase [Acetobacteraceae bacterium]